MEDTRDRPLLAIVQAGGAGGRMDVLTRERAKPALPFAGTYQLVDFPLSSCAHSGITESVRFRDCVVRSGARVDRAIVDDDCEVSGTVGAPGEGSPTPEGLVLVGRGSTVAGEVGPGARLEPGSTA